MLHCTPAAPQKHTRLLVWLTNPQLCVLLSPRCILCPPLWLRTGHTLMHVLRCTSAPLCCMASSGAARIQTASCVVWAALHPVERVCTHGLKHKKHQSRQARRGPDRHNCVCIASYAFGSEYAYYVQGSTAPGRQRALSHSVLALRAAPLCCHCCVLAVAGCGSPHSCAPSDLLQP